MVLAPPRKRWKPSPWPIQPGAVDPAGRGYWDRLSFAVPFLNGAGMARDIVRQLEANNAATSTEWASTPLGLGLRTSGSDSAAYYRDGDAGTVAAASMDGDHGFTLLVDFYYRSSVGTVQGLFVHRTSSTSAGRWQLVNGGSGNIVFNFRDSGGTNRAVDSGITFPSTAENRVQVVVSREVGGSYTFYVRNGTAYTKSTVAEAATPGVSAAGTPLVVGDLPGSTGNTVLGNYNLAAIWKRRALTEDDIYRLWIDPYAFVRPAMSRIVIVGDAVAGTAHTRTVTSTVTSTLVDV